MEKSIKIVFSLTFLLLAHGWSFSMATAAPRCIASADCQNLPCPNPSKICLDGFCICGAIQKEDLQPSAAELSEKELNADRKWLPKDAPECTKDSDCANKCPPGQTGQCIVIVGKCFCA